MSAPGSTVTLTGQGFIARNVAPMGSFPVELSYDGTRQSAVIPDRSGSFVTRMLIPLKMSEGFPKIITASPGSATATLDRRPMLPAPVPATDGGGAFTTSILIPESDVGFHIIAVHVRGVQQNASFQVTERVVVENPLPSPEAATVVFLSRAATKERTSASSALEPLDGNLVRLWTVEPATQRWRYFDPDGYFSQRSGLNELTPGQLYWIRMAEGQTAVLNQRERRLYRGWNLLRW